jgi:hypothetical protein
MAKDALRKLGLALWLGGIGVANFAFAQNINSSNAVTLTNPLQVSTLNGAVANVTKYLLLIAVPLTAIMALVGGFQMITAGGDPEKFSTGRKTLTYAAIGFAVVLLAGSVAAIISNLLSS